MSDKPSTTDTGEDAQAAAKRRRWLTLAEGVAIASVVIAALTLLNNWQGREAAEAARQAQLADQSTTAKAGSLVTFTAKPRGDGASLALSDPAHSIQSIDIRFPRELGVSPQSSTLDPTIAANWFEGALLRALAAGPAERRGRLPVLITADYWVGADHHSDTAMYDIIWETHGRLLRGRVLTLKGIVLESRTGTTQGAIDKRWATLMAKR